MTVKAAAEDSQAEGRLRTWRHRRRGCDGGYGDGGGGGGAGGDGGV